jgi:hypothetical protein
MIEACAQKAMMPVEESFAEWRKDPEYVKAFNALEEEFSLAKAMIEARARRPDAGSAGRAHAHDAGGDRAAGKRPGEALDPHA